MRESWAFARRCWRGQRVLSTLQAGIAIGIGLVGLTRLTAQDPPRGLAGLSALLYLALLICFVALVRRDDPQRAPADAS